MNPAPPPDALPTLGRALVSDPAFRARTDLLPPDDDREGLPERCVQFGTGAFLRGFVEHLLDDANRRGVFGGRVVIVGSTGSGRERVLADQDMLYTLSIQGMEEGGPRQEHRVVGVISRALCAGSEWGAVLAVARDPALELVFSNTTEIGIRLDEEDSPFAAPPRSFPGKLTRFLLERARAFDHDEARGLVVLPCELIENNGDRLRELVLALAERWEPGGRFTAWLERAVPFCNTLVDRIVTGPPTGEQALRLREALGYRDELLTIAEPYRLLAIQGDEGIRRRLGFTRGDGTVVIAEDIRPYRERKVRVLNGAHTLLAPVGLLIGCETVREALEHPRVGRFLRRAIFDEIVPALEAPQAGEFAGAVLRRFGNPFIRHALTDITLQGTMKMRVRVVPSILAFVAQRGGVPDALALGFAAHLLFMRGELQEARAALGLPVPADDDGARLRRLWSEAGTGPDQIARLVERALPDQTLWGTDLTRVPGFAAAATRHLWIAAEHGIAGALDALLAAEATVRG